MGFRNHRSRPASGHRGVGHRSHRGVGRRDAGRRDAGRNGDRAGAVAESTSRWAASPAWERPAPESPRHDRPTCHPERRGADRGSRGHPDGSHHSRRRRAGRRNRPASGHQGAGRTTSAPRTVGHRDGDRPGAGRTGADRCVGIPQGADRRDGDRPGEDRCVGIPPGAASCRRACGLERSRLRACVDCQARSIRSLCAAPALAVARVFH